MLELQWRALAACAPIIAVEVSALRHVVVACALDALLKLGILAVMLLLTSVARACFWAMLLLRLALACPVLLWL